MEKVEEPVIDRAKADSKFVKTIPQKVGFRTTKLMTQLSQADDGGMALDEYFVITISKFLEPIHHGGVPAFILIEHNLRRWHKSSRAFIAFVRYLETAELRSFSARCVRKALILQNAALTRKLLCNQKALRFRWKSLIRFRASTGCLLRELRSTADEFEQWVSLPKL